MVLLFVYTASDKLANLESFREFLQTLEYLGGAAGLLAILIPLIEIGISIALIIPGCRARGLYIALGLMLLFTGYLIYMRMTRSQLPCHCGGAISKLTWRQHIWFNLGLMVLLVFSVLHIRKRTYPI